MEKRKRKSKRVIKKNKTNYFEITATISLVVCFVVIMIYAFQQPDYYDLKDIREDGRIETIQSFSTYEQGQEAYEKALNQPQYHNPVLYHNNSIQLIKYGVVNFKTKSCDVNTLYKTKENKQGYINGCYGTNALFIDGNKDTIKFKMSGVIGNVKREDVEILSYTDIQSIDYYEIVNNEIFHKLSSDTKNKNYSNSIYVGNRLDSMKQSYYYSYDGHYFYPNFYEMADDERNRVHEHAINSQPYYFHYQFVSHKTISNYTANELNTYISKITKQNSKLYHSGYYFKKYEAMYYVNASMMLSVACNESNYGLSNIALEKNNLFGHSVYDSNTSLGNAYESIDACIKSHARDFLANDYLNPNSSHYANNYFGDKESGINVNYASDPYWGEKCANFYARLDQSLGLKDRFL